VEGGVLSSAWAGMIQNALMTSANKTMMAGTKD
jgi:hypothetical protein